ncbi:hypothetical protein NP493_4353g00002 [Ridgeia piscesae]|uniref:Uncharacterized protein n=1 Tax=Ridgeia piscesae TaxID=27915 RepID=A0AAD9J1M2_RIDPI|nr:hypothetical protein NP493_4353g00002 [Ridgeia piscesae]
MDGCLIVILKFTKQPPFIIREAKVDSWVELHFQQNRGLPADSPGVFKPISVSNTQMEKLLLEAQRESSSRTSSRGGSQLSSHVGSNPSSRGSHVHFSRVHFSRVHFSRVHFNHVHFNHVHFNRVHFNRPKKSTQPRHRDGPNTTYPHAGAWGDIHTSGA